jgi:hypothetical protein
MLPGHTQLCCLQHLLMLLQSGATGSGSVSAAAFYPSSSDTTSSTTPSSSTAATWQLQLMQLKLLHALWRNRAEHSGSSIRVFIPTD